jgi:hypothetical protein
MNKTLTVTEAAVELETDGRTLRKFLRAIVPAEARPGKGARWAIARKDLRTLRTKFAAWSEQKARVVEVDFSGDELNEGGESVPTVLQGVSLSKS